MDFTKLKLNEMMAQGAGANLQVTANNKASQQAQAPKQVSNTSNSIGMQQNQMAQKQGNVKAATVQKQGGAPQPVATTAGPTKAVEAYFDDLYQKKEYIKQLREKKTNWKQELVEELGLDDDPDHPFVEVMPFKDFKMKEAKKMLAQQAAKPGAASNPAQAAAQSAIGAQAQQGLSGLMGEETISETRKDERGLTNDQKILNRDKAAGDEDTGAQARRAFRHLALRGHKKRRGR